MSLNPALSVVAKTIPPALVSRLIAKKCSHRSRLGRRSMANMTKQRNRETKRLLSIVNLQVGLIIICYILVLNELRWRNCPNKFHCWTHNLRSSALVLLELLQCIYFQNTGFRHRFSKCRLLNGLCKITSKIPARLVKYRPSGNPSCIFIANLFLRSLLSMQGAKNIAKVLLLL